MKKVIYFLLTIFIVSAVTCKKDDVNEDQYITPCDFDLSDLTANSTTAINCMLDLGGETINLPSNIHLNYDGGDIINGKLVFSGGTIDGRLLSSKLEIDGEVKLKETTFKFVAKRWESIVEGKTTSAVALKNTAELERLMLYTKQLGATVFEIGKFDAYFEVTKVTSTTSNQNFYPSLEAVNIPSDFHLKMSDSTNLRLFPGELAVKNGVLLAFRDVSNAKITGGNLFGDRDDRLYPQNDENSSVGCHLFGVQSGVNVIIQDVTFVKSSLSALNISSLGFSFNPDYKPSTNVTVINCTFKDSRSMGISLTDGRDVTIKGCAFENSGQPSTNSDGGVVGYAINIEPVRARDANGNLIEYQKVFDVFITGNNEKNSRIGFVTVTIGQDITIDNNDIESKIVYTYASGTKISGNRFKASIESSKSNAIIAGGSGVTVFGNEISGNEISGYSLGIASSTTDVFVHDNTIKNCSTGIQISMTFDSRFSNNIINVSNRGISATNTYNNNVQISNNEITAGGFLVYFVQLNNNVLYKDYSMTLNGNRFLNPKQVTISNTNGINFINNNLIGGIEIGNSSNIAISSNIIRPSGSDGIRLFNTHSFVSILDNSIYTPTGGINYVCINNNSSTPEGVTLTNNTCN